MGYRAALRRWHRLLAWLVAIPMAFWLVSGFFMAARPIAEVRGDHIMRPAPAIMLASPPVLPDLVGLPIEKLSMESRAAGPRWVVRIKGVAAPRLADPATGAWLDPGSAADAVREVTARYLGKGKVVQVRKVTRDEYLLEARRRIDGWRVELDNAEHFYVEAGSGEIVAHRSRHWRIYDWLWGLHIMDLQGRQDPHNPWIVTMSALSLLLLTAGIAMLVLGGDKPEPVSPPTPTPRRASTRQRARTDA